MPRQRVTRRLALRAAENCKTRRTPGQHVRAGTERSAGRCSDADALSGAHRSRFTRARTCFC